MIQLIIVTAVLLIFAFGSIWFDRFIFSKKPECKHKWNTQNIGSITTTKEYSSSLNDEPYITVTSEVKLFSVCVKCGEHKFHYETTNQYDK